MFVKFQQFQHTC